MKRHVSNVPRSRYMSVNMGQLFVADIREVFPGDYLRHRCRIGVHLAPMQAPELAPMIIRQDTFFVANRINWDFWDTYISQKLLEDSAVGPFSENKLLPPQVAVCLGSGYHVPGAPSGKNFHMSDVRGVYDLLEGLGMKLAATDSTSPDLASPFASTGVVLQFNAFPLMAYWRCWHDFYRDSFLQNDEFSAYSTNRVPLQGDPFADEQPVDDEDTHSQSPGFNWNAPIGSMPNFATYTGSGRSLPGYSLRPLDFGNIAFANTRGIFSFAKRQPAMAVGLAGTSDGNRVVLPGVAAVIFADRGQRNATVDGVLQPSFSLGMYAPVNMPKDYIFTARQSPVYNTDVATPDSVRDLRKAFQVLGYREKVLRFDNRIKAWLYNMFHVNVSDKRLDSPLWLSGSQSIINTQEILGTVNNQDTVLGQLGGFGIGAVRGRTTKFRSEDHGFLLTLAYISVLPVYGDGVQRFWFRGGLNYASRVPFADGSLDWPIPDFARIGQQTIYRGEVSVNPHDGNWSDYRSGFGYADRFSDLDFSSSDVCGDFRTTLRFWHTGLFWSQKAQGLIPQDGALSRVSTVSGNFVSLFDRNMPNQRLGRTGNVRATISSMLQSRLFDSGLAADAFWVVCSSDYVVSRRLPVHAHPGYADHTSGVIR